MTTHATPAELLERMTDEIFNERDADARTRAANELCSPDIRFVDPEGEVSGLDAFLDKVTGLLDGGDPSFSFFSVAPVLSAGELAIHRWAHGPSAGKPVVTGTDVVLASSGRIDTLYTVIG